MLSEWHIDPMVIEETWTDEFFNLMLYNHIKKQQVKAKIQEESMSSMKVGTEKPSPAVQSLMAERFVPRKAYETEGNSYGD